MNSSSNWRRVSNAFSSQKTMGSVKGYFEGLPDPLFRQSSKCAFHRNAWVLKAERLRDVVVLHGEHLLGHFVTVGENRTRLRPLPR